MVDYCSNEFSCSCAAEEGVEVYVADPPEDEGVGFAAVLVAAEEDNVEEAGDVVGPEI